ncbi:hypothetical protein JBE27_36595 [Streptomyces albiflaviniger]|nr:hypothetical protein [Streptomyces albiflaviniger]
MVEAHAQSLGAHGLDELGDEVRKSASVQPGSNQSKRSMRGATADTSARGPWPTPLSGEVDVMFT